MADAVQQPDGTINDAATGPPGVSRWAIAALGTSVAFFCPLLTVIGPLLAVRALVDIKANPHKSGRGMAIAALWIGVVGLAGWISLLFWWNANVRDALFRGPQTAISAGMTGDRDAFRSEFIGDGAAAADDSIAAFLNTLRDRYGNFRMAWQDDGATAPDQTGDTSIVIPYVLEFDRSQVKADVRIKLFASGLKPKLQTMTVKDPQHAPLMFP